MQTRGKWTALLPFGVFLLIFVGNGILTADFYAMPVLVAFFISGIFAFLQNKERPLNAKLETFCQGAGNENIILMIMIFMLAGAFSGIAKAMGGVEATVNLSLFVLPPNLLVAGLFIISSFISISMGTSVGTISALTPIGVGIAQATNIPLALIVGAIVGGGMFGDNLSMISDTTIATVRTQGCELKDKFRVNFLIVLPAAIISLFILVILTSSYHGQVEVVETFEVLKVLPYLAILAGALIGINVFALLTGGIVLGSVIGLLTAGLTIQDLVGAAATGMAGMQELAIICLVVGGTLELIKANGGIDFILYQLRRRIQTKRGAELGIAALVSVVDLCTANNTIAIVTAGPLAKEIATDFDIDPRRSASILDIFSSCWQGLIPYGAQMLGAAALCGLSPFEIIPYVHYPMLMGVCGLLAILFNFPRLTPKK